MSIADKPAEELVSSDVDFASGGDEPYPEIKGEKSFSEPEKAIDIKLTDNVIFNKDSAPAVKPHSEAIVEPETTFEDNTPKKDIVSTPSKYEVEIEVSFENTVPADNNKSSVKRKKSAK
jgi:hypothetical protein